MEKYPVPEDRHESDPLRLLQIASLDLVTMVTTEVMAAKYGDLKHLRELSAVLKELVPVVRDLYGQPNLPDSADLALVREKTETEREKHGEREAGTLRVLFEGDTEALSQ